MLDFDRDAAMEKCMTNSRPFSVEAILLFPSDIVLRRNLDPFSLPVQSFPIEHLKHLKYLRG